MAYWLQIYESTEMECILPQASEAGGMQGIWHPNYLCGDIDMYIP